MHYRKVECTYCSTLLWIKFVFSKSQQQTVTQYTLYRHAIYELLFTKHLNRSDPFIIFIIIIIVIII